MIASGNSVIAGLLYRPSQPQSIGPATLHDAQHGAAWRRGATSLVSTIA